VNPTIATVAFIVFLSSFIVVFRPNVVMLKYKTNSIPDFAILNFLVRCDFLLFKRFTIGPFTRVIFAAISSAIFFC
jgi:hypothetical protein